MAKIEIRHARPEDAEAIEEALGGCGAAADPRKAQERYQRRFGSLHRHGEGGVLVGISEGAVLGVLAFSADRNETNDVFWLAWFQGHGGERSQKYGKKLLARAIKEARQRGARKLYIDTSTHGPSEDAARCYAELGFVVEAALKDYHAKGADLVIYGLDLARRGRER